MRFPNADDVLLFACSRTAHVLAVTRHGRTAPFCVVDWVPEFKAGPQQGRWPPIDGTQVTAASDFEVRLQHCVHSAVCPSQLLETKIRSKRPHGNGCEALTAGQSCAGELKGSSSIVLPNKWNGMPVRHLMGTAAKTCTQRKNSHLAERGACL